MFQNVVNILIKKKKLYTKYRHAIKVMNNLLISLIKS